MSFLTQCDCIVMAKHVRRCEKTATKRCVKCGDKLCAHCAKQHHAHREMEPLVPKR